MNPIEMMYQSGYEKHINGAVIAIITNTKDPDGMGRVKIVYPWNTDDGESYWARVMSFYAGDERGALFLPEVDDEVLVIFEQGNMLSPIIIGSLWSSNSKLSEMNNDGQNNIKKIKSRSGHEIIFDDTIGGEKLTMKDQKGNSIEIDSTANQVTIKSNLKVSIEANIIEIKADSILTLKGGIVKIN